MSDLTSRKAEIVALVEAGVSQEEIAARLNLSLPTVKNHVHSLLEKLDVERRSDAASDMKRDPPTD